MRVSAMPMQATIYANSAQSTGLTHASKPAETKGEPPCKSRRDRAAEGRVAASRDAMLELTRRLQSSSKFCLSGPNSTERQSQNHKSQSRERNEKQEKSRCVAIASNSIAAGTRSSPRSGHRPKCCNVGRQAVGSVGQLWGPRLPKVDLQTARTDIRKSRPATARTRGRGANEEKPWAGRKLSVRCPRTSPSCSRRRSHRGAAKRRRCNASCRPCSYTLSRRLVWRNGGQLTPILICALDR